MTDRGYPAGDDEQALADLSVEHAQTVGHFRAAQEITRNAAAGNAATEDLRQALIHYRALFTDLLPNQRPPAARRSPMSLGVAATWDNDRCTSRDVAW
jgi:hypothetical protein